MWQLFDAILKEKNVDKRNLLKESDVDDAILRHSRKFQIIRKLLRDFTNLWKHPDSPENFIAPPKVTVNLETQKKKKNWDIMKTTDLGYDETLFSACQ